MKEIPASNRPGVMILVSDEDYEFARQFTWHIDVEGYAKTNLPYPSGNRKLHRKLKKTARMHRMLLAAQKGEVCDHINYNRIDNRRENLRLVTYRQNNQNRRPNHSTRSSPFKGVVAVDGKWKASIKLFGVTRLLGRYQTPEAAAVAYDSAAKELFGEFAYTNFPAAQA